MPCATSTSKPSIAPVSVSQLLKPTVFWSTPTRISPRWRSSVTNPVLSSSRVADGRKLDVSLTGTRAQRARLVARSGRRGKPVGRV